MTLIAIAVAVMAVLALASVVRALERERAARQAAEAYVEQAKQLLIGRSETIQRWQGRALAAEAAVIRMTDRPRGAGGRFSSAQPAS